jgi:hypothetical protein
MPVKSAEAGWGHQFDFVDVLRGVFEEPSELPKTRSDVPA